jgi:hypothetical protein
LVRSMPGEVPIATLKISGEIPPDALQRMIELGLVVCDHNGNPLITPLEGGYEVKLNSQSLIKLLLQCTATEESAASVGGGGGQ